MEKLDLNESLKKINQDLVALGEKLRGLEPTLLKSKNDELKEELKHYTELADALNKKVKDQQKQITDLIQSNQKLRENETCLTDSLKRGNEQLQKSYATITKLNEDIHKLSGKIANLTETGDYAMTSLGYASGGFTGSDKLKEKFYDAGAKAGTRLSDTNPLLVKNANLRLKVKQLENALFEVVVEKESAKQELTELNSKLNSIKMTDKYTMYESVAGLQKILKLERADNERLSRDVKEFSDETVKARGIILNLKEELKIAKEALADTTASKIINKQEYVDQLNAEYEHAKQKFETRLEALKNELEVKRATIQNYEKDLEGKSTKMHLFDKGIKEAGYESLPDLLADHTRIKNELALSRVLQDDFNLKHNDLKAKIDATDKAVYETGQPNLDALIKDYQRYISQAADFYQSEHELSKEISSLKTQLDLAHTTLDKVNKIIHGVGQPDLDQLVKDYTRNINQLALAYDTEKNLVKEVHDLKAALIEAREQRDHFKGDAQRLEKAKNSLADERDKLQELKNYSDDLIIKQRQTIIDLNNSTNNYSVDQIAELKGRLNKQHIELNQLYRERKTYKKLDIELATTKKLLEKEEKLVAIMRQKAYEYKKECEDLKRHQTPTPIDLQERERRELKTYQEQAADLVSLDNNVIKLQEHIENLKKENDTLRAQRDASDAKIYELSIELHKDAYRNELLTNLLNELSLNGVSELKDYIEKLKKDFKEYMDKPQFTGSRGFEDSALLSLLKTEGINSRYDWEDHLMKHNLMGVKLNRLREDALKIIGTTHGNYEALKNRIDSLLRP